MGMGERAPQGGSEQKRLSAEFRIFAAVLAIALFARGGHWLGLELSLIRDPRPAGTADPWLLGAGAFLALTAGLALLLASLTGRWQGLFRWLLDVMDA